jgi:hypothetical protein
VSESVPDDITFDDGADEVVNDSSVDNKPIADQPNAIIFDALCATKSNKIAFDSINDGSDNTDISNGPEQAISNDETNDLDDLVAGILDGI